MNLFEVPEGCKIRLVDTGLAPPSHRHFEESEVLTFSHIDGMFSLCFDKDGQPVHLFAGAEVEIVE